MPGSLQPRVKVWVAAEDVTATDLNAEFDNVLTAMQPLLTDDYSTNQTQMQVQTDPGEVGSESLATTLAGEIARLRFMIAELSGESYWYESPPASLNDLINAVGTGLLNNRIASGAVRVGSQFPAFLVPSGAARTVTVDVTPTPFVYYINGVSYTMSTTDVSITGLTLAPSSQNTCLINDAVANDQEYTKHTGENGSVITVDAMGTEITALTGKLAAFKLEGAATEYFLAYVNSSTQLTKARRGYFFDSSLAPVSRSAYTNNDTITLMKLTWIFAKTDLTITATYNNPVWSDDEPTSPAQGDYWFDLSASIWKRYDVSSFVNAEATLIGVCAQDGTNTVIARPFEFFRNWSNVNTVEVIAESNTQVKSRDVGAEINVWGTQQRYSFGLSTWDMTTDLESGITEGSSRYYYFYITETGDKIISDIRPYDRREDLMGFYHPYYSWRCVGWAWNNGSSNLESVESYFNHYSNHALTPAQTAAQTVEVIDRVYTLDSSGGAFTVHLPPAALWRGQTITFFKSSSDTNNITIDAFDSETINGETTTKLCAQYGKLVLMSNGAAIFVLDRKENISWHVYKANNQTGVNPNNSEVKITFDTVTTDTAGGYATGTSLYTAPLTGQYEVGARFAIANTNVLAARYSQYIYKAGAIDKEIGTNQGQDAGVGFRQYGSVIQNYTAGETIGIYIYGVGNNSASTLTCSAGITITYFYGYYLGAN